MCEYLIKILTLTKAGRETDVEKRELAGPLLHQRSRFHFRFHLWRYSSISTSHKFSLVLCCTFLIRRSCPGIFSHIVYFSADIKAPIGA